MARRPLGVALVALAPVLLAACRIDPSRAPCGETCAQSGAHAAALLQRSSFADGSFAADRSPSYATVGYRTEGAPCGPATIDGHHAADGPRSAAYECCPPTPCEVEGPCKSYAIAAADIVGFEFLVNQYDRHVVSSETYGSDGTSFLRNLSGGWQFDKDPFATNQFQHPYGGAIYHGFARSAGLNFWESFGYDFAGSALWEIAGEQDPPSINDQITTPFAGAFLGEALFRTANLLLERSGNPPSRAAEWKAALVSPSTGFNRLAYGDCFDAVYPSHDPAVFAWWGVGVRRNATLNDTDVLTNLHRDTAAAAFSIDYGLPGKRGYAYRRPFDYFHFEATATSSENALPENIVVRGLLTGSETWAGPSYRGIWGLYGSYDYFSPEVFTVSSTALSLGTTGQYLVSDRLALQGSLLGGVGFTAAGTTADTRADRGYRYSVSPQALVALRAVYGDVAMLDLTANEYFLANDLASNGATGSENIVRAQLALTVRITGHHAVRLEFVASSRDPSFSGIIDSTESVGALSLYYVHLSDTNLGVVR
jgi:hypothetical protein